MAQEQTQAWESRAVAVVQRARAGAGFPLAGMVYATDWTCPLSMWTMAAGAGLAAGEAS